LRSQPVCRRACHTSCSGVRSGMHVLQAVLKGSKLPRLPAHAHRLTLTGLRLPAYAYRPSLTGLRLPAYAYQPTLPGLAYRLTLTGSRLPAYAYQPTLTGLRLPAYAYRPTLTGLRLPAYAYRLTGLPSHHSSLKTRLLPYIIVSKWAFLGTRLPFLNVKMCPSAPNTPISGEAHFPLTKLTSKLVIF